MRLLNTLWYTFPRITLDEFHLFWASSVTPLQQCQATAAMQTCPERQASRNMTASGCLPVASLVMLQAIKPLRLIHGAAS